VLEAAYSNQSAKARELKLTAISYGFFGRASRVPPFTESPVITTSLNFSPLSQRVISLTVAAFLLSPAKRYGYVSAICQVLLVFRTCSFIALLLVILLLLVVIYV